MSFCERPLWERLAEATSDPNALFDWVFCPYAVDIGIVAVGTILLVIGFIGLYNWSESWSIPLVWLALVTPLVSMTALPGGLIRIIAGLATFGVALMILGLYWWWGRS